MDAIEELDDGKGIPQEQVIQRLRGKIYPLQCLKLL